jgi:hypothetical protein
MSGVDRPPRASYLPDPEELLRRQTDEIVRLYGEFMRRLSHHGVRGVTELVSLHEQVCRAAAAIATQEIDFALAQIGDLSDRIRLVGARLERLSAIKRALEAGTKPSD